MDRHGRDHNYVVDRDYVVVDLDDDNCDHNYVVDRDYVVGRDYVVDRDYVVVFDDDITVTRPRVH